MLEQISLFILGGSGYLAVELAWRGTSHWTMFLAGGICLCLLHRLAARANFFARGSRAGAAGVSGLEVCIGLFCRELLHIRVWDYSAEWGNVAGLICPPLYLLLVFAVRLGRFVLRLAQRVFCSPVYCTRRTAADTEVQILVLPVLYNKSIKQKGGTEHDPAVKYVGGHIEVYSETGEFLFSADTMREAWEELSA